MYEAGQTLDLLMIDDDEDDYIITAELLAAENTGRFKLEWIDSYEAGLAAIERKDYAACLLDYRLGARDGLSLLREVVNSGRKLPIILLTGQGDREVDQEALHCGAADYLVKGSIDGPLLQRSILHSIERVKTLEALRQSQEKFRSAFDFASIGMALVDLDGRFVEVNKSLCEIIGYTEKEMLKKSFQEITHPDDLQADLAEAQRLKDGEIASYQMEKRYIHKEGHIVWILLSGSIICSSNSTPAFYIAQIQDITKRKQAEDQLKASLREKEVLLKENHHRVKNNLQIISSLLKLQAVHVKDSHTRDALRESQSRIRAMALVHEKLYQAEEFDRIDSPDYIRSLVNFLSRSYQGSENMVEMLLDVENIPLSISLAIPLGLIIQELVTNCFKYAFPDSHPGHIWIELRSSEDNTGNVVLIVRDDGVGLPNNFDIRHTETLGMELVRSLVNQLGGSIEILRVNITEFRISFNLNNS